MSAVVLNAELVTDSSATGDRELVGRFVATRDQAAFAELVRRHSSIVMGVCRRVLHDPNDIDDVFQATFLVLVRNAGRVRNRSSLASWLYGVAYRLSLRVARQKQRRRETVLVDDTQVHDDPFGKMADRHDQQVVDLELNGLPERYRQPLVLRYLSGKSTLDVASELGITVGAVEGLLKRGKDELRRRLVQRGITLGTALLAIQATQQAVQAATDDALIEATIQASLAWQAGTNPTTTDPLSDRVVDLAGKEILTMTTATKTALAVGLTLGGIAIGLGGANALSSQSHGQTAAARLNTTINASRPVVQLTERSIFAAAPTAKEPKDRLEEPTQPEANPTESEVVQKKSEEKLADFETELSLVRGAAATAVPATKWDLKSRSPNERKIESALQENTEVSFTDQPLNDALNYLKEHHRIEIIIDESALADEGISSDQSVNVVLSGVKLESVLNTMLEPLQLEYMIKNEVMFITTRDRAAETFDTRVYNLRLLPELDSTTELMDIITATIAPDRWDKSVEATVASQSIEASTENSEMSAKRPANLPMKDTQSSALPPGGGGSSQPLQGSIRVTGKTLVVRQTQRVHREIVDLLEQLKRVPSEDDE